MDWKTFIAIGVNLTFVVAILAIIGSLFGLWYLWKAWRNPTLPAAPDRSHLQAQIQLDNVFGISQNENHFRMLFWNEGQYPAYNFRPAVRAGTWEASGHATETTLPPHQLRFFRFPYGSYWEFPLKDQETFTVTAPYRDGTGDRIFVMRFLWAARPDGKERLLRTIIVSEENCDA